MSFAQLFRQENLVCGLKAADRDGCFVELLDALVANREITKSESAAALEAIRNREKIGSTGIGSGVAIPHVKLPGAKKLAATIGVHAEGVDFNAIDGEPVNVIFLIVRPADDSAEHLKFLQWVSRLARHADFRRFMARTRSTAEMMALMHEMSGV